MNSEDRLMLFDPKDNPYTGFNLISFMMHNFHGNRGMWFPMFTSGEKQHVKHALWPHQKKRRKLAKLAKQARKRNRNK
jgi:hypothetical protein